MLVTRAYRHKARFTSEQERQAFQFAGCRRFVFNAGLEQRTLGYHASGRSMSYKQQTYGLKDAKADPDLAFLADAPAHVLQQALKDLDAAFIAFFEGRASYPKYRRRGEGDSFRFPDPDPKQIGTHDPARPSQVRLPKLGWVSLRNCYPALGDRLFEGRLRNVTVTLEADGWWVSFCCEVELPDPATPGAPAVGVDLGVANSAALSTGELVRLPVISDREWEKIGRLQTAINRKQKGSRNRERAKRDLARYRKRLTSRKRDAIHKLTTRLAREHEAIALEDLRVANMTRSAAGTAEQPGTNVAQKAGLNRAILDQSWGEIRHQLTYKIGWYGSTLVTVPAAYTSQTCRACGHVAPENRESQAVFRCESCGHEAHADTNAAANILQRGLDRLAGDTAETAVPADGTSAREPSGSNACEDARAAKTPERARPSRKGRPRGHTTKLRPAPAPT